MMLFLMIVFGIIDVAIMLVLWWPPRNRIVGRYPGTQRVLTEQFFKQAVARVWSQPVYVSDFGSIIPNRFVRDRDAFFYSDAAIPNSRIGGSVNFPITLFNSGPTGPNHSQLKLFNDGSSTLYLQDQQHRLFVIAERFKDGFSADRYLKAETLREMIAKAEDGLCPYWTTADNATTVLFAQTKRFFTITVNGQGIGLDEAQMVEFKAWVDRFRKPSPFSTVFTVTSAETKGPRARPADCGETLSVDPNSAAGIVPMNALRLDITKHGEYPFANGRSILLGPEEVTALKRYLGAWLDKQGA